MPQYRNRRAGLSPRGALAPRASPPAIAPKQLFNNTRFVIAFFQVYDFRRRSSLFKKSQEVRISGNNRKSVQSSVCPHALIRSESRPNEPRPKIGVEEKLQRFCVFPSKLRGIGVDGREICFLEVRIFQQNLVFCHAGSEHVKHVPNRDAQTANGMTLEEIDERGCKTFCVNDVFRKDKENGHGREEQTRCSVG